MYGDFRGIALKYITTIQNRDALLSDDFERPLAEVLADYVR